MVVMAVASVEGAQGGRPGALPMTEQEGKVFLLNSCLIRLIVLTTSGFSIELAELAV